MEKRFQGDSRRKQTAERWAREIGEAVHAVVYGTNDDAYALGFFWGKYNSEMIIEITVGTDGCDSHSVDVEIARKTKKEIVETILDLIEENSAIEAYLPHMSQLANREEIISRIPRIRK